MSEYLTPEQRDAVRAEALRIQADMAAHGISARVAVGGHELRMTLGDAGDVVRRLDALHARLAKAEAPPF